MKNTSLILTAVLISLVVTNIVLWAGVAITENDWFFVSATFERDERIDKLPKFRPDTLLCDGHGHYGYVTEGATDRPAFWSSDRNEVLSEIQEDLQIRRSIELSNFERARMQLTEEMPWQVCTEKK